MVARISSETFTQASYTPAPDPSDSDDLHIALETARALEAQGDLGEAARWLRRAADRAERQGNDERVLVFARAAAELTAIVPARLRTPAPSLLTSPRAGELPASSVPPASPARTPPPRVSPTPVRPPRVSSPAAGALRVSEKSSAEGTPRGATIRVAIPASGRDATVFVVKRLEIGQPLPPGTTEAMLVLTPARD